MVRHPLPAPGKGRIELHSSLKQKETEAGDGVHEDNNQAYDPSSEALLPQEVEEKGKPPNEVIEEGEGEGPRRKLPPVDRMEPAQGPEHLADESDQNQDIPFFGFPGDIGIGQAINPDDHPHTGPDRGILRRREVEDAEKMEGEKAGPDTEGQIIEGRQAKEDSVGFHGMKGNILYFGS